MSGPDRFARRLDEARGIVEEAHFLGAGAERVFGVLYSPLGAPSSAVVICPAVCTESLTTYRNDVLLARELASRGIAAYRFHYRGTGHSDGEVEDLTFQSMREDALAAVAYVEDRLEVRAPAFVGTRFGALVAASAAAASNAAPLILWEPVLEARTYFREARRASMMFKVKEGISDRAKGDFSALLDLEGGTLDVLGYPICRSFYESSVHCNLLDEAGEARRRVLLMHGESAAAAGRIGEVAATLRERGCEVDVEVLPKPFVWWFLPHSETENVQPQLADLIRRTAEWSDRWLATEEVA